MARQISDERRVFLAGVRQHLVGNRREYLEEGYEFHSIQFEQSELPLKGLGAQRLASAAQTMSSNRKALWKAQRKGSDRCNGKDFDIQPYASEECVSPGPNLQIP